MDITLSVCVDTDLVTAYNEGFKLDDIIVLNLQGGKDFFVTVTGEFLPTCFGSSLETLVHLHKYVREVPTGQLLDLTLVMMTSLSLFFLFFLSFSFLTLSLSLIFLFKSSFFSFVSSHFMKHSLAIQKFVSLQIFL